MLPSRKNVVFLLLFSLPFSFQHSCESFSGVKVHDYALLGYSFASFNMTRDLFSCAHRCLPQHQCKSYNYAVIGAQQGLCELNSAGRDASKPLQYRPGFVFVEALSKKPARPAKSCFDHWKDGARISGTYRLNADCDKSFDVYCDFGSEPGWVWTLVMSQSHANRAMREFRSTPFSTNRTVDEEKPNWEGYRLSLERMKDLKSQSTHWRVTCSFPAHGVDYTDYVRAKFTEFNPLTFQGTGVCKKVEYMNVRGHSCTGCTSAWWQKSDEWLLCHDSSKSRCEFGTSPGFVGNEDNFGFYKNTNPNFRCSSSANANTNHWFGRRV